MPDQAPQTTQVAETKPTFGAWLKALLWRVGNLFIRYPLAMAATVLIIVGGVLLAVFGRNVQLGGLLGKLWGHKTETEPDAVLHPPPGRVDDKGQPIQPGQPDDKGFVQPVVLPVKPPNVFTDPDTVTVVKPDGKEVVLQLPTGVKNSDVQQVVMVSPNVYQVANNDKGVDAGKLLEELNK